MPEQLSTIPTKKQTTWQVLREKFPAEEYVLIEEVSDASGFSRSGTTCKMAYLSNRKSIMSEISVEYCELSKQRLSECLPKGLFA